MPLASKITILRRHIDYKLAQANTSIYLAKGWHLSELKLKQMPSFLGLMLAGGMESAAPNYGE